MTTTNTKSHVTLHPYSRADTGSNLTRQMSNWGKHLLPVTVDSKILSINLWEAKAAISVKSMHLAFYQGARVRVLNVERKVTLILPIRDSDSP